MAAKETYLTKEGEDALRRELAQLRDNRRPALAQRLKEAVAQGKLRENANYDDARERLWQLGYRIQQIENILGRATVIEDREPNEVDKIRRELHQMEQIRLPQLVKENQELSDRISAVGLVPRLDILRKARDEIDEKINSTEKRIKEIDDDLNTDISQDRKDLLKKTRQKLMETDRPRLNADARRIKGEIRDLNGLRKEFKLSRNLIENVNAQIRQLKNRLNSIISPETERELVRELHELVDQRRPALAIKLREAVSQGDLKENADYHDTKEQLGFVEGRIQVIEKTLRDAIVVVDDGPRDEVRIGSTVVIQEDGEDFDEEYRIVGSAEANPRARKISEKSPIGSALLGKRIGNKVKVETPDGPIKFKIVDIR